MEVRKIRHHRWEHPSNIMIVGPTKSGKTEFVRRMIRHRMWLFRPSIRQVVFVYGIWQDSYDEMKKEFGEKIKWVKGLPEDPYTLFSREQGPGLLIIDDLMGEIEAQQHRQVSQWFTKGTHHMNVSLALLVQNMFPKNMRTISLNAHIIVLFPNPRDQTQVRRLIAQAFPGRKERIKKALKHAHSLPYRPLILNFHQSTPQGYRLSIDPFPEDLKQSKSPFPKILLPSALA